MPVNARERAEAIMGLLRDRLGWMPQEYKIGYTGIIEREILAVETEARRAALEEAAGVAPKLFAALEDIVKEFFRNCTYGPLHECPICHQTAQAHWDKCAYQKARMLLDVAKEARASSLQGDKQ